MMGNMTYTPTIPTMVQAVSDAGIPPFMIFAIGLVGMVATLSMVKVRTNIMTLGFVFYSVLGVQLGLVPAWITVLSFAFFGISMAVQVGHLFRGIGIDSSAANAITGISLKPTAPVQEVKTVNCGNCGGPNVNQVKCEWCGQVL